MFYLESNGVYMKWIHTCFDNLIHTLQSLNMNKQVDAAQIQLSHWLRDNSKLETILTLAVLHEDPGSYEQFEGDFNVWEKRTKKVLNFAKELKDKESMLNAFT